MQLLPNPDERDWLVEALADLLRTQGSEPWLRHPIVEPTERFFPEAWSSSLEGADRIAHRLMQYAGLHAYDVEITTFATEGLSEETVAEETGREVAAGHFLGVDGRRCRFALSDALMADAETIAGVLGHEVARAYRAIHRLPTGDTPEREGQLADLTAVYLGFGILQANNSSRSRSAGGVIGTYAHQSWMVERIGHLPSRALAYLLALQCTVRGLSSARRRRLRKRLEPNPARSFVRALPEIRADLDALTQRLVIPRPEAIGPEIDLVEIRRPLPEFRGGSLAAPPGPNAGWNVFRIRHDRSGTVALLAFGLGVPALVIANGMLPQLEAAQPGEAKNLLIAQLVGLVLIPITLGWFGYRLGKGFLYHERCSDRGCERRLDAELTHCPGCGGRILGTLDNPNDRLRAEEEILAARGESLPTGETPPVAPPPVESTGRDIFPAV